MGQDVARQRGMEAPGRPIQRGRCIVIENDGRDEQAAGLAPADWRSLDGPELIALIGADGDRAARLAPLPALQSALETGFSALQQGAVGGDVLPPERGLAVFDRSAIDQIHRILIETGREELNRLEKREAARIRDQELSAALVGFEPARYSFR